MLIEVLVYNNIADPDFIDGGWAIAEFVVRVVFDRLIFGSFRLTVLIAVPY